MQRFLTFVVETCLSGKNRPEELKETLIGVAVFDRDAAYDPKTDPVVRVEARRLRSKLQEYYERSGKDDSILIELPKGSYVPAWRWQLSPPEVSVPTPGWSLKKWLLPVILIAAFLAVAGAFLLRRARHDLLERAARALADQRIRSLAVLPFRNLTGDASQDYLIAGLTDEIITDLAKTRNLTVISRTSADTYRSTNKLLPQIARELHVDAVVEGTVVSSKDQVRVTAQLIRAATDSHLWAESYVRQSGDIFVLQSEIAGDIAHQIGVTLNRPSRTNVSSQPINREAYEAYLRGRYFWNRRTLDGLEKSIDYYRQALEIDPSYAKAYAALGDSYVLLSSYGGPSPTEPLHRAREAANQALQLDDTLAEAHVVLAAVKLDSDWDWLGATREFQQALRLSPGYPTAHHWYALHLSRLGRFSEAGAEIERALQLDPLSLIINTDAGEVYYCAREPDQALAHLHRALELDPNFAEAHLVLGKVYEEQNNFAQALAEFEIADRLFGGAPNTEALKAHALAMEGKQQEALAILSKLEELSKTRYVSGVDIAIAYCGLKHCGNAMDALEKAYSNRGKGLNIIGADPLFDNCRQDPRFQALLRRLKLIS